MTVHMRAVLESLGLEHCRQPLSSAPAFRLKFGNLELEAAEFFDWSHGDHFLISGIIGTARHFGLVETYLPILVQCREEGLALIGYALKHRVPQELKPPWLIQAERLEGFLPWIRERQEYRCRPICSVNREWLRLAFRSLRKAASKASPSEVTTFEFDGNALRIEAYNLRLAVPASGTDWSEPVSIRTASLRTLPRRLMRTSSSFSVWKGSLVIDNRSFAIVDKSGEPPPLGEPMPPFRPRMRDPDMTSIAKEVHPHVSISIDCEVAPDGAVEVSGQDLGKVPLQMFGSDSYEYWVRLKPDALPRLVEALLHDRYKGNVHAVSEFRDFCEANDVAHEFGTWPA